MCNNKRTSRDWAGHRKVCFQALAVKISWLAWCLQDGWEENCCPVHPACGYRLISVDRLGHLSQVGGGLQGSECTNLRIGIALPGLATIISLGNVVEPCRFNYWLGNFLSRDLLFPQGRIRAIWQLVNVVEGRRARGRHKVYVHALGTALTLRKQLVLNLAKFIYMLVLALVWFVKLAVTICLSNQENTWRSIGSNFLVAALRVCPDMEKKMPSTLLNCLTCSAFPVQECRMNPWGKGFSCCMICCNFW